MKRLKLSSKITLPPMTLGLSEDEQYYCLVKNHAEKFSIHWQKKSDGLALLLSKILQQGDDAFSQKQAQVHPSFNLIRAIPYQYIWRKTLFLPRTLNEMKLHQQIIRVLKNEQPLTIDRLYFDYQRLPCQENQLDKIVIYAINKDYAQNLNDFNSILDCELHCYLRGLLYLNNQYSSDKPPCFSFKGKIVQFSETEILFSQNAEDCMYLPDVDIDITDISLKPNEAKQLYCLALGASLWNGKVLI